MDKTIYYKYADGSVAERTVTVVSEDQVVPVPDGATEITKDEYDAALAQIEQDNAAAEAAAEAADMERRRQDYEALLAAGVPDATAQRLSGYEPDPGAS